MSDKYVSPSGRDMDVSPISQMGRVTVNCRVDIKAIKYARAAPSRALFYSDSAARDEGTWDFNKPELVVMRNAERLERSGRRLGRTPLVLSSLSALRSEDAETVDDAIALYELVGMVQGGVKVHLEQADSVDVSVTMGGLTSLVNTDIQHIYNGDLIYWDFPKRVGGTGPDKNNVNQSDFTKPAYYKPGKIPIVVRRFTYENAAKSIQATVGRFLLAGASVKATDANGGVFLNTLQALIDLARDTSDSATSEELAERLAQATGEDAEERKIFKTFVAATMRLHSGVKNRVFFRSLSNAAPSTYVDGVFLSHRH